MKAWLLRWLGAVSLAEFETLRVATDTLAREMDEQTIGSQRAIGDVITELNALRNSLSATVTQEVKPPVRVLRNFREFRTVIEHKTPERKS